jgi:abortive infection bacteriophage resistance protein
VPHQQSGDYPSLLSYIASLKADGLVIVDDHKDRNSSSKAQYYIPRVGYHRFSLYFNNLKTLPRTGNQPLAFDDVLSLYKFDRRLRLISLDALERIEVSIKSYLHEHLVNAYGWRWYLESATPLTREIRNSLQNNIKRSPEFAAGDLEKVEDFHPDAVMETISLGDASRIFSVMPDRIKIPIAKKYHLPPGTLQKWLRSVTYVRNASAHHRCLLNTSFKTAPKIPSFIRGKFGETIPPHGFEYKYYAQALVIYFLLQKVARNTKWNERLLDLLTDETIKPAHIDLARGMGFPNDWHLAPYWRLRPVL